MEENEEGVSILEERYGLAMERIHGIREEETVPAPYFVYFQKMAGFLILLDQVKKEVDSGRVKTYTLQQWEAQNELLYQDILPGAYAHSYANPSYASAVLGKVHGPLLSFLYTELRGIIAYLFEKRLEEIVVLLELFLEIYNQFEAKEAPQYREIQQSIYWFVSDYSDLFAGRRIREAVDPSLDFAVRIVMDSDLNDLRYLYQYGEYVSENERKTAAYLNTLPEETIAAMADTFTEGYRRGFVQNGKDLSKKKTVNIRYRLGFERMIRRAVLNFRQMGLEPVIYRAALSTITRRGHLRIGYSGAIPNPQFDYDHRSDNAIYLDRRFMDRKLSAMRAAYESCKALAAAHAGPAVVEVFGEAPFTPKISGDSFCLSEKQQQLETELNQQSAQLTNQYITGKERSFTIIAFPVPEIGPQFEGIFRETIKINTLDYKQYQQIQQTLIDALDQGVCVRIQGQNGNCTDLTVALHPLLDPSRETIFENCVADVNIPAGEVFTSPRLAGTDGLLHVSRVYLNGLKYTDLRVWLKDGMVSGYSCADFASEEENRAYFFENVLYHHETLPLGEFAIGTNTTAYRMAKTYQIAEKLPILIAEKMGPHFALGDTCYSWTEDVPVYNPDGREIIARDNEVSLLRKEDPSRAYFGCHTDITIPYEEIGCIQVLTADGAIDLLRNGKFVLPGTEALNLPLE